MTERAIVTSNGPVLHRLRQVAGRIANFRYLGVAAVVMTAFLTLPVAGSPLLPGGEFSYQAAMIVAFRDNLQWGSQIVWTYGPYGYMNEPFFMDFGTWAIAFGGNLAGHLVFFGALALFLVRIRARPWQALLASIVIVLLFDRYPAQYWERFPVLDHEVALAAILLLYLATEPSHPRAGPLFAAAAGLLIGYLWLDKGTFLLVGAGLIAAYIVLCLTRRRAAPVVALMAGLAVGFVALWLLDGQSIAGIPGYFRTDYEVIAGYTPAMSWFRDSGVAHPLLQFGLGAAMLGAAALSLLVTLWQRNWALFRLLLLAAPLMIFAFKNAFVRFDEGHALAFWALVGVVQGLVLVRALAAKASKTSAPAVVAGATVLSTLLLVSGVGPWVGGVQGMQPAFGFPDNLAGDRHALALLALPERRQAEDAQVNAALRAAYPLPPEVINELRQGTVDVLPVDLQVALAYGFQWDPQPVLQGYNAYSPYLDHLDAQHLMGSRAPRFVLFNLGTVDGRYALFDGPETYRALFERYQVRQRLSNMVVLERRPDAPLPAETHASSAIGQLGQWVPIPNHGDQRLYGRVQVNYTLRGRALYLLNSPPELHIRFRYGGGQISPPFRFVPAIAPDGLDLSSFAPDTDSAGRVADGQFDQPIEAIQIQANSPVDAYEQEVHVNYFMQAPA